MCWWVGNRAWVRWSKLKMSPKFLRLVKAQLTTLNRCEKEFKEVLGKRFTPPEARGDERDVGEGRGWGKGGGGENVAVWDGGKSLEVGATTVEGIAGGGGEGGRGGEIGK